MRLAVVDHGHAPAQAAVLDAIRERSGHEPLGVVKTLLYRPERFGLPFSEALDEAMRIKPERHHFAIERGAAPAQPRHMSVTGG